MNTSISRDLLDEREITAPSPGVIFRETLTCFSEFSMHTLYILQLVDK